MSFLVYKTFVKLVIERIQKNPDAISYHLAAYFFRSTEGTVRSVCDGLKKKDINLK